MISQNDIDGMKPEKVEGIFLSHSGKEESSERFEDVMNEAGVAFTDEDVRVAMYTGYETVFKGYWFENEFYATHVNDVALVAPVKI